MVKEITTTMTKKLIGTLAAYLVVAELIVSFAILKIIPFSSFNALLVASVAILIPVFYAVYKKSKPKIYGIFRIE
jgi:hypothetical protein